MGFDHKSVSTHVSKKLIGDLKIAKAILSWSFLDACPGDQFSFRPVFAFA
jgi:hypothetical protein